jgi:hypothetical protein
MFSKLSVALLLENWICLRVQVEKWYKRLNLEDRFPPED